jgi:DNA repair exonuclease SbcCD ATPase subunit
MKQAYDEHIPVCKNPTHCAKNKFYENALFFLQEEVEELEQQLPKTEFSRTQKEEASVALDTLIADLNNLKVGQQISYDDLMQEFKDLREFLYLDKTNFTQLLLGSTDNYLCVGE